MKVTSSSNAITTDDSFEALLARHNALHSTSQPHLHESKPTGELSMSWKLPSKKPQPAERTRNADRANRRSASKNTFRKMKH
jgi:hypothetical protein